MTNSEFEALEAQWTPLFKKFSSWPIPGMDEDDIMQELRLILLKVHEKYNAGKHTKFITFLYTSCLNKMLKLLRDSGEGSKPYQKYVPSWALSPLCGGAHSDKFVCEWCIAAAGEDDLLLVELFSHASPNAKWLAGLILVDELGKGSWAETMGANRVKSGIEELKLVLRGG